MSESANGDRELTPGEQVISERVEAVIFDCTGDPFSNCPVKFLGVTGGIYHFLKASGEYHCLSDSKMFQNTIVGLFGGRCDWLIEAFPSLDKKGNANGFDASETAAWLILQCEKQGLFDNSKPFRGIGVWYDDDLNTILVHCGKVIYAAKGMVYGAGLITRSAIYAAAPPITPPATSSATKEDVQILLNQLKSWNFSEEIGAELVLGFIGQSFLSGALQWRAHMMVTGEAGSGKSWLAEAVRAVLGGAAHNATNNVTEAGLRQNLTGSSRTLILDETEHEDGGGRVQAVIELLRHMSGGQGARVLRGSSGGKGHGYSITGCAYLSSILHTPLKPQDRSRITHLRLNPIKASPDQAETVRRTGRIIEEMGPKLWRRAIDRYAVFDDHLACYRAAFLNRGLDSRAADQISTLLAGRDILLHDGPPSSDYVEEQIDRVQCLVSEALENSEEGEGQQCLNHLFSSQFEVYRGGERRTISQVILDAMSDTGVSPLQSLENIGLKLVDHRRPEHVRLYIANSHASLDKIFSGTRWSGKAHMQALRYLPGAKAVKSLRFSGTKIRATEIPGALLPSNKGEPGDE